MLPYVIFNFTTILYEAISVFTIFYQNLILINMSGGRYTVGGFYFVLCYILTLSSSLKHVKDQVDNVIEDEITDKMTEDLLQSLEKKFQVDLQKSVDTVLGKIKLMLNNGTTFVQEKLTLLQEEVNELKQMAEGEVDKCLIERQNETTFLAEKALHQMVLCGYALIGHDPATALAKVLDMKQKIRTGLEPIRNTRQEISELLKVCGHTHDSLKKVVKCVISKSPVIKSSMLDVTTRMIEGVVELTKLMAHGAMHEACLIEVVRSTEEEAFQIMGKVKLCSLGNGTKGDMLEEPLNPKASKPPAETQTSLDNVQPNQGKEDLTTNQPRIKRMMDHNANSLGKQLDRERKRDLFHYYSETPYGLL